MDVSAVLTEIHSHPRIREAGMVLVHYGMVRGFDLAGRPVEALNVRHDPKAVEAIRADLIGRPGIVDVVIRHNSGRLKPGDPIMLAAVAGETRDKVFPVMRELIERLKSEASVKSEDTAL